VPHTSTADTGPPPPAAAAAAPVAAPVASASPAGSAPPSSATSPTSTTPAASTNPAASASATGPAPASSATSTGTTSLPGDRAPTGAEHRWFPDGLDDALLDTDEHSLLQALGRPTLIRIPGEGTQPPRALSVLLHGDESTGLQAIHRVLQHRRRYPFDLYVMIGNVQAALAPPGFASRYLDDQEDFNRIWGFDDPTTPQRVAADAILAELRAAGPESVIDIHNNTGDNPFYAILTRVEPRALSLATLFTTTILRWDLQAATMMEALNDVATTAAVECGLPGRPESLAFAIDGIRRYLAAPPLDEPARVADHDLLGGLVKVTVDPDARFRFGGELDDEHDLVLRPDADVHNFVEVPPGHVLGAIHPGAALPLRAVDARGRDVTADHLVARDGEVALRRTSVPVMMTRTVAATRKDCLFYLATETG
jgi:hypothetical protein